MTIVKVKKKRIWCLAVWLGPVVQAGTNWRALSGLQENIRQGDISSFL